MVWLARLVWYETFLFRPRMCLVWISGAFEALQFIICRYTQFEQWNDKQKEGITNRSGLLL